MTVSTLHCVFWRLEDGEMERSGADASRALQHPCADGRTTYNGQALGEIKQNIYANTSKKQAGKVSSFLQLPLRIMSVTFLIVT